MDPRRDGGQASLEYVGVVALVAVLVTALAVPLLSGAGLADAVGDGIRRALCVATGGLCDPDRPCVVRSARTLHGARVTIAVVRYEHRHVLLREERSDGSVAVTVVHDDLVGPDLNLADGFSLRAGRRSLRAGLEADATLLALRGRAETWIVDRPTADRLERRLAVHGPLDLIGRRISGPDLDGLPEPTLTTTRAGLELRLNGVGDSRRGTASVMLSADAVLSDVTDRRTGRRTVVLAPRAGANGSARALGLDAEGEARFAERYVMTYDADGRPLELNVVEVHDRAGSARPLEGLRQLPGGRAVGASGRRRVETETRVDLTDPAASAAVMPFLAFAIGDAPMPRSPAARDRLRDRLRDVGTVDARTFAVDVDAGAWGADGRVKAVRVGADYDEEDEEARLVAAVRREPGGEWLPRSDCLGATT